MDSAARAVGDGSRSPSEANERTEKAFARAARHSRRVRALKLVLPVAAAAITLTFVGYSILASWGGPTGGIAGLVVEDGDLVMSNPQLDGFTSDDLPYELTAARARQSVGGGGAIDLEEIRASVPIDDTDTASIEASAGTFDRERNRLRMDGGITMSTTSGLQARLESADIDMETNDLVTDRPVDIVRDGMRIGASSLHTKEGGKVLLFENDVRVRIDPERQGQNVAEAREAGRDE